MLQKGPNSDTQGPQEASWRRWHRRSQPSREAREENIPSRENNCAKGQRREDLVPLGASAGMGLTPRGRIFVSPYTLLISLQGESHVLKDVNIQRAALNN